KLPKEQFVDKFIYNTVNKKPIDDLVKPKQEAAPSETIKFNSPAMQMAGFADYDTAFLFEEREAEKAAQQLKASAEANQAQTGNSLQPRPLTPTDTTQNPDALAAQEQRMQAEALQRIQNSTQVPSVPVSDVASKPRELTPAEQAQADRMNKEALSRLVGAKITEKRALIAEAKQVKQAVFTDTPIKVLAKAATPVPSPLIPTESQNAYKVKENNLTLDFRTGKSTPTKDPVPMPKVTWKEPVQAVAINPIYAQLPQHKVVATFVPDGDTFNATSDSYKTKGERARKAGGIICRIDSIETPETAKPQYGKKGQPYGEEAAKILQQMVLNKEISIRVTKPTDGESNYGRDVCQIEVAGKDVSVELIREGAAWVYKEYNHYGQGGLDLESNARQSKLGLWGLPNPVYPPDFRHNGYQNP
ncbi:MAG: thermonuclease family protein, partial [Candidatus Riesia sp.]|nr:thermonuclease family protein [Candidatus Riesia sp.]